MAFYADTGQRARLIAGLRGLAVFLEANPDVPAPLYADVLVFPSDGSDAERRAEIDVIAGRIGEAPLLATEVFRFHGTVAVAASTLAVAALFNPVRHRVQHSVDRRFNRARYDAGATAAAFAARLNDAVDLDSICDDLAGAVHQALEPAHVSVWTSRRS